MSDFSRYKLLNPRHKRLLVSIFSSIIHLFGVVTDDQISALRQNMAKLSENLQDIVHVLEHSLSMINAPKLSIDRNRQHIKDILDSLTDLDRTFTILTEKIQLDVLELSHFTQLYVQVDVVIEDLNCFLLQGLFLLEHFK